jgi:myo-inositol-1(or 4)-monophosphatase
MTDDLELALRLARGAGDILLEGQERLASLDVRFKGRRDPVTEIDRASEEFLRSELARERPGDRFLGEEGGERPGGTGERLWIVDPLDGTVNYMHGHPVFCVSIALAVNGRVQAGVVHAPRMRQTFRAARGRGAFLDDRPLRVSASADLASAVLATGFAYNRGEEGRQTNLDNFSRLTMSCLGLRRMGAAALDIAWVAAGIFDGFWELYLSPWDVAAGALLVEEASGRVTDFSGGDGWLSGRNILATNGRLHDAVAAQLSPFRDR